MNNKRKSFPLRISPDLFQELKAWADQEMRSVNGQIEFVLREAVNKRKRPQRNSLANNRPEKKSSRARSKRKT